MVRKYTFVAMYKEDLGMKPRHYEVKYEGELLSPTVAWLRFWAENNLNLLDSVVYVNHQKNV